MPIPTAANNGYEVPSHTAYFATVAEDKDLTAEANAGHKAGLPCRVLTALVAQGNWRLKNPDGTWVTLPSPPVGTPFLGQFIAISATGTTATGIAVGW